MARAGYDKGLWTRRRSAAPPLLLLAALVLWLLPLRTGGLAGSTAAGARGAVVSPASPSGTGAPPAALCDVLVDKGTADLSGDLAYGRVCVLDDGTLLASGLNLRVGELYVDASSSIQANGAPGDCGSSGDAGGTIAIAARRAVILGSIAANGGNGSDAVHIYPVSASGPGPCDSPQPAADGGDGGSITLQTAQLDLEGTISADGGGGGNDAGDSTGGDTSSSDSSQLVGGNGGKGGTVTLLLPSLLDASLTVRAKALGGAAGSPGGSPGPTGKVAAAALTAAQAAALPPLPPAASSLGQLQPGPARQPILSLAQATSGMACGTGDLSLGQSSRLTLSGDHTYPHVCLSTGATLLAGSTLILRTETLYVGAGAILAATGSAHPTGEATGTYASAGTPNPDQRFPHPGVAGQNGAAGMESCSGHDDGFGGKGGGAIVLLAQRMVIGGTISANGGSGDPGGCGACTPDSGCSGAGDGGGGGSGGGILLLAGDLQLTGTLSVLGGAGGAAGTASDNEGNVGASGSDGPNGNPGIVKIFAATLHAPATLPVSGPWVLGRGNGGAAWTSVPAGHGQDLHAVAASRENAWAVGGRGSILHTADGGRSWHLQAGRTGENLEGVAASGDRLAWAVGTSGTILHTADGGATWQAQIGGAREELRDVDFTGARQGWIAGMSGTILHTADGGVTWHAQGSPSNKDLLAVAFAGAGHGWAVGSSGTILHTSDGGATWHTQSSPTHKALRGVAFSDSRHGWAVGDSGTILATTNGGASWNAQDSGTGQQLFSISCVNAQICWVVGWSGSMLRTTDGGSTWEPQLSGTTRPLISTALTDSRHGWAVGLGTILSMGPR